MVVLPYLPEDLSLTTIFVYKKWLKLIKFFFFNEFLEYIY